jgi:leucyl aminopeptidase (aminopeptidase T)
MLCDEDSAARLLGLLGIGLETNKPKNIKIFNILN